MPATTAGRTRKGQAMTATRWHNCYDGGWGDLITPDSFAHPAKMAYGLLRRILQHGVDKGYWQAGDILEGKS